ncbi:hypothetical protein [Streptomyces jumonjinensis]|uniref:hypothetical protein n=1 Tax=Streptomyces jumonjinensis TaxID=1945 RepID=UPI0037951975
MSDTYDPQTDDSQEVELSGPDDDAGFYSSQLKDWVPVCPYLKDSAVRLYWIMRALVIEKHGPVRKITLRQLCYLLPAAPVKRGDRPKPSSPTRIRNLLRDLTGEGLITTPEGKRITTSSRAGTGALRIKINNLPRRGYDGPRNVFSALAAIKEAAAAATREAVRREAEREAARKAARKAQAVGQISDPQQIVGQISDPRGQISDPRGQISDPHFGANPGADLQDHADSVSPPFIPSAHSSRSGPTGPVRPSVSVGEGSTDGRTDGGEVDHQDAEMPGAAVPGGPAAADAAPENGAAAGAGGGAGGAVRVDPSPGVDLLLSIGSWRPDLLLTGQTLLDQGRMVTGLLDAGWRMEMLRELITSPLPENTRSVGAVIAARLRAAASMPVPRPVPVRPGVDRPSVPAQGWSPEGVWGTADGPTPVPASYAEREREIAAAVAGRGVLVDCEGDDRMCSRLAESGHSLCAEHLGWPLCSGAGGTCKRRVPVEGQVCAVCAVCEQAESAARAAGCSGAGGTCGRNVQTLGGLCFRCEIAAEAARREKAAAEADWAAAVKAAAGAAEADSAL